MASGHYWTREVAFNTKGQLFGSLSWDLTPLLPAHPYLKCVQRSWPMISTLLGLQKLMLWHDDRKETSPLFLPVPHKTAWLSSMPVMAHPKRREDYQDCCRKRLLREKFQSRPKRLKLNYRCFHFFSGHTCLCRLCIWTLSGGLDMSTPWDADSTFKFLHMLYGQWEWGVAYNYAYSNHKPVGYHHTRNWCNTVCLR